jgi:hypothetical protein
MRSFRASKKNERFVGAGLKPAPTGDWENLILPVALEARLFLANPITFFLPERSYADDRMDRRGNQK